MLEEGGVGDKSLTSEWVIDHYCWLHSIVSILNFLGKASFSLNYKLYSLG